MAERLISPEEVATLLGVPPGTLKQWRYKGTGPRSLRVGRHVRYRPTDVEDWIDRQATQDR